MHIKRWELNLIFLTGAGGGLCVYVCMCVCACVCVGTHVCVPGNKTMRVRLQSAHQLCWAPCCKHMFINCLLQSARERMKCVFPKHFQTKDVCVHFVC